MSVLAGNERSAEVRLILRAVRTDSFNRVGYSFVSRTSWVERTSLIEMVSEQKSWPPSRSPANKAKNLSKINSVFCGVGKTSPTRERGARRLMSTKPSLARRASFEMRTNISTGSKPDFDGLAHNAGSALKSLAGGPYSTARPSERRATPTPSPHRAGPGGIRSLHYFCAHLPTCLDRTKGRVSSAETSFHRGQPGGVATYIEAP